MSKFLEPRRVSRRSLIAGLAAAPLAMRMLATGRRVSAADELIIREREPLNLESDFAALDSFITPNDKFYVRSHFAVPKLDVKAWQLKVEGAVKSPLPNIIAMCRRCDRMASRFFASAASLAPTSIAPPSGNSQKWCVVRS